MIKKNICNKLIGLQLCTVAAGHNVTSVAHLTVNITCVSTNAFERIQLQPATTWKHTNRIAEGNVLGIG